jgi:AraC family transcriptional regulator
MSDAYGQRLGERMRAEHAQAIITRGLRKADLAVTEVRSDHPSPAMSGSFRREDAFLVGLLLRDFPRHEYWEDGQQAPLYDLRAGEIFFVDLKRDPAVLIDKPYHSLHFYLPRAALDAIADDAHAPRISDLGHRPKPGASAADVTISRLGSLVLPSLSRPDEANPLFVDYVLRGVGVHIAQTYGGMRPVSRLVQGGLAPWQERRATEILRANLQGGVPLKEVARECGISVSHFAHAFRRTLGVPPHRWLIDQRIALSKQKLRDGRLSLTDVAAECGFSDQSHFAREFRRTVGISPGAWRRAFKQ